MGGNVKYKGIITNVEQITDAGWYDDDKIYRLPFNTKTNVNIELSGRINIPTGPAMIIPLSDEKIDALERFQYMITKKYDTKVLKLFNQIFGNE